MSEWPELLMWKMKPGPFDDVSCLKLVEPSVAEVVVWLREQGLLVLDPRNRTEGGEFGGASRRLLKLVAEQAEDEGLWFVALTAPEAYLQQELRRLHALIEEGTE